MHRMIVDVSPVARGNPPGLPVPTFRELRARCGGVSSSVLADRLRELSVAGITCHVGEGYALTVQGRGLLARLAALDDWAATWQPPERPPLAGPDDVMLS
jgi:DNA-binding HxlR family transcriptional regulator